VRRLQTQTGRDQQRAYFDVLFLSRNSPVMRPYYDWQAMGTGYAEPAVDQDFSPILSMVRRHEGEARAGQHRPRLGQLDGAQPGVEQATGHHGRHGPEGRRRGHGDDAAHCGRRTVLGWALPIRHVPKLTDSLFLDGYIAR
jgi:hypothetical protein